MGNIAVSRVLRPFLWVLWLALASLLVPAFLAVFTPLLLLVWIIGLIASIASPAFREQIGFAPLGYLSWLLLWPALIITLSVPALAVGLAALLHFYGSTPADLTEVPAMLHRLLPEDWQLALPQPSLQNWAAFCVVAGIIGFSIHCVYVFVEVPWRLKQIRLVRALPRSKARSAAIGVSELEGTARAEGGDSMISPQREGRAAAFYLEDDSGRIRVEAAGGRPARPLGDQPVPAAQRGRRRYTGRGPRLRDRLRPTASARLKRARCAPAAPAPWTWLPAAPC